MLHTICKLYNLLNVLCDLPRARIRVRLAFGSGFGLGLGSGLGQKFANHACTTCKLCRLTYLVQHAYKKLSRIRIIGIMNI